MEMGAIAMNNAIVVLNASRVACELNKAIYGFIQIKFSEPIL